jgi:hypothetical protein
MQSAASILSAPSPLGALLNACLLRNMQAYSGLLPYTAEYCRQCCSLQYPDPGGRVLCLFVEVHVNIGRSCCQAVITASNDGACAGRFYCASGQSSLSHPHGSLYKLLPPIHAACLQTVMQQLS